MTKSTLSSEYQTGSSDFQKSPEDKNDSKQSMEALRASLRFFALDKQKISVQLHQCRQTNVKLAAQMRADRSEFQAKLDRMQMEINNIRQNLVSTKIDFMETNRELRTNLQTTTRTTELLSLMFLRMRESKLNAERKRNFYEMLCRKLGASTEEQAKVVEHMAQNDGRVDGPLALKRISQLINENTILRIKRAADRMAATRMTRNRSKKISKRMVGQLVQRIVTIKSVGASFGETRMDPMFCQKMCHGSEVTLFDRSDYVK